MTHSFCFRFSQRPWSEHLWETSQDWTRSDSKWEGITALWASPCRWEIEVHWWVSAFLLCNWWTCHVTKRLSEGPRSRYPLKWSVPKAICPSRSDAARDTHKFQLESQSANPLDSKAFWSMAMPSVVKSCLLSESHLLACCALGETEHPWAIMGLWCDQVAHH